MADIEYLDRERELLWKEINRIKNEDLKIITDKIVEMSKSLPKDIEELKSYKASIEHLKSAFKQYQKTYDDIVKKCSDASLKSSEITDCHSKIESIKSELEKIDTEVVQQAQNIQDSINEHQDLPNVINQTIEHINNWGTSYKQANRQIKEIKQAYTEIFGGEYEDENGAIQKVTGSLNELNVAYDALKENLKTIEQEAKSRYNEKLQEWESGYTALKDKVKQLLPGAMQAGLASAFIEKMEREQKERKKVAISFYIAIVALVGISFLPVWFNWKTITLNSSSPIETIKNMGAVIWAMLPIYVPILWVAIFANKRINLSKKLIEEYSYKEAVAKTYEGLSTQIQALDDEDEISKNLRERLINITLDANADNPGKYINNYDKSDNPILDVLNNKNLLKIIQKDNWKDIFEALINLLKQKKDSTKTTSEQS